MRLIDAVVEHLHWKKLGFILSDLKQEGRPAYESSIFLNLYFHGYLNGIRGSRRLERECYTNVMSKTCQCFRHHTAVNADGYKCLVQSGEAKIGLLQLSNRYYSMLGN